MIEIMGLSEEEVLDYCFHDDGVRWTLVSAKQQRAQEGRYTLTPEGDSTRVRFELTVETSVPVPGFLVKRGAKGLMEMATDGLRKRVLEVKPVGPAQTDVTLSYDWSRVPKHLREHIQFPPFDPQHLDNSLMHLAELATASL